MESYSCLKNGQLRALPCFTDPADEVSLTGINAPRRHWILLAIVGFALLILAAILLLTLRPGVPYWLLWPACPATRSLTLDVFGELLHKPHQFLDIPLAPLCEERSTKPVARRIHRIGHCFALRRDDRFPNAMVVASGLAFCQTKAF
jgi:hypothetical protein